MQASARTPADSTVDPADVARFERLGAEWWNPDGPMKALHRFNPVRVGWIRDRASAEFGRDPQGVRPLDGLTILDIGCGGGILSEPMARLGAQVTGIDPAPGNVDIARLHAASTGLEIDYRAVMAEDLAASGATFDIVLTMEVIEHVTAPAAFMATAGRLVRPGGLLFAATLNRTMKSFALAIVGAEYVLGWVQRGTHNWDQFVRPEELADMISAAGLDLTDESGVVYDLLRDRWSLSRDMDVNYMMAARRPA